MSINQFVKGIRLVSDEGSMDCEFFLLWADEESEMARRENAVKVNI